MSQKSKSIQPRTSLPKFLKIRELGSPKWRLQGIWRFLEEGGSPDERDDGEPRSTLLMFAARCQSVEPVLFLGLLLFRTEECAYVDSWFAAELVIA